jgi:beta-xylosidase
VADAARPEGPYTDRGALVCQEAGSIDAVAVRDENGRRYLVWKEDGNSRKLPTLLWAQPLSDDGVRLVGEKTEILRNEAPWEAHLVEGPYILRRGDWFYLFYSADACCGRRCNYKLGVARSRRLLGPWERFPGNPILAGNEQWKCPGHGTIVQDQAGRTYLLYHAYEASTFEFVGRQGLLDEVTWNADGWPAINSGKGPSGSALSPSTVAQRRASTLLEDDFNKTAIDPGWQWPWDQTSAPSIEPTSVLAGRGRGRGGWLRLTTGTASIAIAARPTRDANYTATTAVDVASIAPGARAGLAAFGNRDNAIAVTVERAGEAATGTPLTVVVWQTQKGQRRTLATTEVSTAPLLHLRLSAKDRGGPGRVPASLGSCGAGGTARVGPVGIFRTLWKLQARVALRPAVRCERITVESALHAAAHILQNFDD